jgi:hypothetical protein
MSRSTGAEMASLAQLIRSMPTRWVANYVQAFESGRVQKHPHARFVNQAGECCIVGALAGARTAADVAASPVYAGFLGSGLEELSRRFESRRLTGQEFYEEALLALAVRGAAVAPAEPCAAAVMAASM